MQTDQMPSDVAAVLTCSCTGCTFIRRTWKDPAPDLVQSLDACVNLGDSAEAERAGQALFAETDLQALNDSILSCPCAVCMEFQRLMNTPDQGQAALQAMMAEIKAEPDAPARIEEFLRVNSKSENPS